MVEQVTQASSTVSPQEPPRQVVSTPCTAMRNTRDITLVCTARGDLSVAEFREVLPPPG